MNIKNRLGRIRATNEKQRGEWIANASDGELEVIASSAATNPIQSEWLKTLTDEELETIIHDKPGAVRIRRGFYEYQEQIEKNGNTNGRN